MSTGRAQEMQKGGSTVAGCRRSVASSCDERRGSVGCKPRQEAAFEFLRGSVGSAAVVGVGDFPEFGVGIVGEDDLRMTDWNVAVYLAVNQEKWSVCSGYGIFGGDFLHVEVVLETSAEEADVYQGAEDCAAYPGTEMEGLSHAIVGDLAKIGEGGFGGDGAEVRVSREGLEKLCGAHGFA